MKRLFADRVARSPGAAKMRMQEYFGCYPSEDGNNIDGIVLTRDTIFELTRDSNSANATVIVAPHTHWAFDMPIIVRKHGDDYMIGPHSPQSNGKYVPVSFVFSEAGPLAFEWVDETVRLEGSDVQVVFEVIKQLNDALYSRNWPIGIALNYRFKGLFSDRIVATVEYPVDDNDDRGQALIVPMERYVGEPLDPELAQVAWHAYSDFAYGLDRDGVRLLRAMRTFLRSMD